MMSLESAVFMFASVGLALVRFTLTKGAGVIATCVILWQLVLIKVVSKDISFSHSFTINKYHHVELTLQYVLFTIYIYIYC